MKRLLKKLGSSREVISRNLKILEKENFLKMNRKKIIIIGRGEVLWKKPIIGISASMIFEEKDELFLGDKYSCVAHSYVDAIYKSGGIPVVLPILKDVSAIREQVKLLDGIVLSGGRDVDPHFYGEDL